MIISLLTKFLNHENIHGAPEWQRKKKNDFIHLVNHLCIDEVEFPEPEQGFLDFMNPISRKLEKCAKEYRSEIGYPDFEK